MNHSLYMKRCLELAEAGRGKVAPNPLVGSVLVYDDKIVAEGFHQKFGEAHAEVNCINSLKDTSILPHCTLYVNLEPCSHFGKTPPCANLIIQSGIKKVVIGMSDPNELVAGKGIQILKDAGIEVITGILEEECKWLNRRFIKYITKKEPYIILKWAQTLSGYIAPDANKMSKEEFEQARHITGFIVQKQVHKWRTEEDAILVGSNTALLDNPALNARAWVGRNPLRIIVDRNLKLPLDLKIFDNSQETWIINKKEEKNNSLTSWLKYEESVDWMDFVKRKMFEAGKQSLIIEGGLQVLTHVIESGNWDEAQVFYTPAHISEGVKAPSIHGVLRESGELDNSIFKRYINGRFFTA